MAGQLSGTMFGLGYNESELLQGMQVGDTLTVYDFANYCFKEVVLVQADGAITANAALQLTAQGQAAMVTAAGQICNGVNDVSGLSPTVGLGTGVAVVDNNYFFMTFRGGIRPLLDAAVAEGPLATGSATAGRLVAWTDGVAVFRQTNLQSLAASGAGGVTNCYMH